MKLHEVCDVQYGQKTSRYQTLEGKNTARVPVYSYYDSDKRYTVVNKEDLGKLLLSKAGMVLLNASSHRAELVDRKEEGKVIPSSFIVLQPKNIDPQYLTWHLNHDHYFKHQLQKALQGSSIGIISVQHVKDLHIRFPDEKTQKMIGAIVDLKERKEELVKEREALVDQILKHINREGIIS